jgi:hypothetical protein
MNAKAKDFLKIIIINTLKIFNPPLTQHPERLPIQKFQNFIKVKNFKRLIHHHRQIQI